MGTVHKFRRPPKNRGQFRGYRPNPPRMNPRGQKQPRPVGFAPLLVLGACFLAVLGGRMLFAEPAGPTFTCISPVITDGDTLRCGDRRVRLAGIDAPELPGHCREGRDCAPGDPVASTENLKRIVGTGPLECRQIDIDHYNRTVAQCSAGGVDLSCQQLEDGQAIRRYGSIDC